MIQGNDKTDPNGFKERTDSPYTAFPHNYPMKFKRQYIEKATPGQFRPLGVPQPQ